MESSVRKVTCLPPLGTLMLLNIVGIVSKETGAASVGN